jgi:hypothetical protein
MTTAELADAITTATDRAAAASHLADKRKADLKALAAHMNIHVAASATADQLRDTIVTWGYGFNANRAAIARVKTSYTW